MRSVTLVCAFVATVLLSSSPALARVYPTLPQRFLPCITVSAYSPAAHSFAAIRLGLQDRRWTVLRQDQSAYQITAQSCTRPPGAVACAAVTFGVDASGQVTVWLAEPNATPANVLDNLQRWMRALERSFNQYRCYTDEVLQSLVGSLGIIVMPVPVSATPAATPSAEPAPSAVPTN